MDTWKDETSYVRGAERIPQTWARNLGPVRVFVTRHIRLPQDTWGLRCDLPGFDLVDLKTNDLEQAKTAALRRVKDFAVQLNEAVDAARNGA